MDRAATTEPEKATAARLLCQQGRWLDVVGYALDWQLENPGDARAFFYQGVALAAMGRLTEAESSYRRALQLDPLDFRIWNNLATLLFEAMDRQFEATQCLAHALKLDPGNQLGWANLASMNGQIGRHELALECAERALALDSGMVEAHLHRARAAQMLGRPEIVRSASEALAQLPPEKFQRAR
ncbi:MAG TPA: tetratricopeptide repeat protein [Candidatus Binatia bacterium]|nr:tetratricopeptide repeat protein [Candidatus Binatia bacterium]